MIECTALQSRVETVGLKCYFVDQTGKTPRSDRLPAKFSSKFIVTKSESSSFVHGEVGQVGPSNDQRPMRQIKVQKCILSI